MPGQGRPPPYRLVPRAFAAGLGRACAVLVLLGLWFATGSAVAQAPAKLRLTWGGGTAKAWHGAIALSEGRILSVQPLGIEADAPGSAYLAADGAIHFRQRTPRSFDGVEIDVAAPNTARLAIDFHDPAPRAMEAATSPERLEFTLAEVAAAPVTRNYAGGANWLTVRRAPGDLLRVAFQRDSLVFAPGESFAFDVFPQLANLPPATTVQLQVKLLGARGGAEAWRGQFDATVAADGTTPRIGPVQIPLPATEGVYDVILSLVRWQFRAPLFPATTLVERRVQLVVLDKRPPPPTVVPAGVQAWRLVAEIDPSSNAWWKRLPQFSQGPLGSEKLEPSQIGDLKCMKLAPGGWQAYPLTVEQMDVPHTVEIEYPAGWPQTMGISIVEPNAAGKVLPIGLDSGIDIAEPSPGAPLAWPNKADVVLAHGQTKQTHRLIFWPRTKNPWVLLTNRRGDAPAAFAVIRVYAGGGQLPVADLPEPQPPARLVAAWFDRPVFAENFSASEAFDEPNKRTLDDWVTFHDGARRLIQYLKHAGYNGAMLPVVCEGSSLYPSALLEPTPRHDSGPFFSTGQDPIRKDVLELLLRMFDREGLRLVPAIQFATPLPALEDALRQTPSPPGIAPIGPDGRSWTDRLGTQRGLAPYYNLLDPAVQRAMLDVTGELVARYGQHPSFAGLALQHGPDTFAQLPGPEWGLDDATSARFAAAAGVTLAANDDERFAARAEALQGAHRAAWLDWRAAQVAEWHRQVARQIAERSPRGKLYLDLTEWTKSPAAQRVLRPALPPRGTIDEALLEAGLAPARYADQPSIVVLRPRRLGPAQPLAAQGANFVLANGGGKTTWGPPEAQHGTAIYCEPQSLLLPGFDAVSPFGAENTLTWQFSTLTPAAAARRRALARSLADADQDALFEGGRLLPLGQEAAAHDLLQTLRRLPEGRFTTVEMAGPAAAAGSPGAAAQPIIIRTLTHNSRTYVYLVNDSPWEAGVELSLEVPPGCRLEVLGSRRVDPLVPTPGGLSNWRTRLAPYDVAAFALGAPGVKVRGAEVALAPAVKAALQARVRDLGARLDHLPALPAARLLANPGFESPPTMAGGMPGWIHSQNPQVSIALDPKEPHGGGAALRVENRGVGAAWVRSEVFPTPTTGRLSFSVWVKADPRTQPPLRLALEGRLAGTTYYKFATVGAGGKNVPLNATWTPYLFQLNDLPPSGLTDLRVGFDLMGPGTVWIDDLELRDLKFDDNERAELSKTLGVANFQLGQERVGDCLQTLEGYWPQFLIQHVPAPPPPMLARQPNPPLAPRIPPPPLDAGPMPAPMPMPAEPPAPSFFDRFRGWVPGWSK